MLENAYDNGLLPDPGGLNNQPNFAMQAVRFVRALKEEDRQRKTKK